MTTTTSARLRPLAVGVALFVFLPWLSYVLEAAEEGRAAAPWFWPPQIGGDDPYYYCLSWRLMVEAGNAKGWRAVPAQCVGYVRVYMAWGQYHRDVGAVAELAAAGADGLIDAWVLDVDDTCLSNQPYYQVKQFGAYDPVAFRAWASWATCPGIPAMQWLFQTLRGRGFRVFLVTGRDEETLGSSTAANLAAAGFSGSAAYRGQSAVAFKSAVRRKLAEEEGYRIRGNVGDQWSDLQGECAGDRVFKVPNPMYLVP
ncbi:acid phosphatase 1 isoform X2 [Zea mays]|uniref:acid phosphatase 1 isoform X2 n=1 Tax=Zea mays TaxID=4577 RepID=UPI0009A9EB47|nr:acid phosphatase 1 isoform X2 [Zea mays]|eukprot:XP_020396746.1 acid phosphatase 1 isoform X2 [Zea mays]